MTKKLLPAMIGAALVGSMTSAAADVTIFGQIDESVVNKDIDAGLVNIGKMPSAWGATNDTGKYTGITRHDVDDTNLQSTNSSIGVKGSEDLGNGLKAIFMLDFQYDIDNVSGTGNSLTDRDQWVGLAGNFGTVRLGTASTSYKAHGAKIDPLYRTAAQGRSWGQQSFLHGNAGEEGEGRADNSIFYASPNWNGLEVMAHYTLDSDETSACAPSATKTSCEDDNPYGIGVSYTNGGILVFADYLSNDGDADTNAQGELEAWKVGGKYTLNNFAVYAQYEDITDDFGNQYGGTSGAELDYTLWHVAGSYTMGNNMLYLGYGSGEFDDIDALSNDAGYGNTSSEQTNITIAGIHNLSKRTFLYAAYIMHEQDNDNGLNDALSDQLSTETSSTSVNDPEANVFALGLRHKF